MDFVRRWSEKTEIGAGRFNAWLDIAASKLYDWRERYYEVKLGALQFFGAVGFGMPFWDGLEALAVTLPAILWLARAFAERSREEAVTLAVQLVDDHLGYNRVLGSRRYRMMVSTLASHGELQRLIAWYSR